MPKIAALLMAPGIDYTQAPPGADKLLKIVNFVGWAGFAAAVIGFVVAGIMMILNATSQHGGSGGQMKALGWTMAGAVLVGTASLWATTLAG